jgi:mannose-6-phosphate isomerase-like protein (cupin superfamily)
VRRDVQEAAQHAARAALIHGADVTAARTHGTGEPVDLLAATGRDGPLWGMASEDLNATLLGWPAGHLLAEHVNADLDVLLVVVEGAATVTIDGTPHELRAPAALLVPRGARRAIRAGADGTRYLSVHRRRGPLQIAPRAIVP